MTTFPRRRRRRGEPLAALALLLTVWAGGRMVLWESPFASPFSSVSAAVSRLAPVSRAKPERDLGDVSDVPPRASRLPLFAPARRAAENSRPAIVQASTPFALSTQSGPAPVSWSSDLHPSAPADLVVQQGIPLSIAREQRWHIAGWAAWRAGSGLPAVAGGARPASYGGSQVGVVATWDLAHGRRRPALHLRATYAPDRPRQTDVAAGAGLRPFALAPVRVMAEVRATRVQGYTALRPAVLAVTELPQVRLPFGLTADGYAQGGWVGGRYATPFADGQARIAREIASPVGTRLSVGAGAWGGAQKFAERVDVGPTVVIDLPLGRAAARLALDYRVKVAGNASPGDGAALTLSTGF